MKEYRAASLFVREWGMESAPAVLYWDGLGGCGLHANEIAPVLVDDELIEGGIHDLVSFAPAQVAELVGSVVQPLP